MLTYVEEVERNSLIKEVTFKRSDPDFLTYKNQSKSFKEVLFGSDFSNDFLDLKATTLRGLPTLWISEEKKVLMDDFLEFCVHCKSTGHKKSEYFYLHPPLRKTVVPKPVPDINATDPAPTVGSNELALNELNIPLENWHLLYILFIRISISGPLYQFCFLEPKEINKTSKLTGSQMSNRRLENVGRDAFFLLEKVLKAQPAVIDSNEAAKKYGGVVIVTTYPPSKRQPVPRNPPATRKISRWGF
ncbi:hypothetical protein M5K25_002217 [Dendrobium thyrsiflorum]|uniref:Uncharacterized protein n=1 Tax=Dendrobium thyrsiflorum TaxID=117978 RepID=A0ABD0VSF5_DENTH